MPLQTTAFLAPTPLIRAIDRTHSLKASLIPPPHPRIARARMSASISPSPTRAQAASVPAAFDWRNQWYPVVWILDLPRSPFAFTLWDKDLVIFQDSKTKDFVVFDDVCPHRAGSLSEGLLMETDEGTQIRCSYHGWTFNTSGTCTDIPCATTIPKAACMKKRYPTTVWNGLIFAWFGDKAPDESLLPVPRNLDMDDVAMSRGNRRRLPVSFDADIENLVDPSHVDWVHHGTGQGRQRSNLQPHAGVEAGWENTGLLEGQVLNKNESDYKYWITFLPPCSVFYYRPAMQLEFCIWHRPIARDQCEFFALRVRSKPSRMAKFLAWITPRWLSHAIANLTLDGDNVIVYKQMANLQKRSTNGYGGEWKKMFLLANGRWDTMVKHVREFIDVNAVGMPWESALSEMETRVPVEDLTNRLLQHTKDCSSCSGMLRWATRALWAAGVCMNLGVVLAISAALVSCNSVARSGVSTAGAIGLGVCLLSGVLAASMVKLRQSLIYSTKWYDVSH